MSPAAWPQGYPLRSTSFRSFVPRPVRYSSHRADVHRLNSKGGVIMTNLRALVGAGFLLGVMGFVVSVPLGGPLSSVLVRPTQSRSARVDYTCRKVGWFRRRFCPEPHTKGSRISLWRSRSNVGPKVAMCPPLKSCLERGVTGNACPARFELAGNDPTPQPGGVA